MEVQYVEPVTTVFLSNEDVQDGPNIQEARKQLYALVDAGRLHIIVDFSRVEILAASAAVALLINLQKKLRTHGGALILRKLSPPVHEVFNVTRLTTIFDIR